MRLASRRGEDGTGENVARDESDAVAGAASSADSASPAGESVAKFGARELAARVVSAAASSGCDVAAALGRVFPELDDAVRASAAGTCDQTGSTVVCVVVSDVAVTCAWLGDSRAVLGRGSAAVALSADHKPQMAAEKARIAAAGGHVFRGRVNGVLAVSRALGDFLFSRPRGTRWDDDPSPADVVATGRFASSPRRRDPRDAGPPRSSAPRRRRGSRPTAGPRGT